jgi:hypothetical protein
MKNAFGFHVAPTAASDGLRLFNAPPNCRGPARKQRVRATELDPREEQFVIGQWPLVLTHLTPITNDR